MMFNANIHVKGYMIEDTKILYVSEDGTNAARIIEFLTQQAEVEDVELDQKNHPGKYAQKSSKPKTATPAEKKTAKKKANKKKKKAKTAKEEF